MNLEVSPRPSQPGLGARIGLWGDTPGTAPSATSSRFTMPGTIREIENYRPSDIGPGAAGEPP